MNNQLKSNDFIKSSLKRTEFLLNKLSSSPSYISSVALASKVIINAFENHKFVYVAGNGGSAAHSQHFAAELVSRFNFDRNPLPAIALTTDSSIFTAISNDYGFEKVFERQIEGLSRDGDVFVGFSTSGKSQNIIKAFRKAEKKLLKTIAITGEKGIESFKADVEILIPSSHTPLIQEMHGVTSHILCDLVEKILFKPQEKL